MSAETTAMIEGQSTRIIENDHGLPRTLEGLLRAMSSFGFTYTADPVLRGTRTSCEQLREHRFVRFREGRWFAQHSLHIRGGGNAVRVVPAGVLTLALLMCEDCGAVCVRDRSPEDYAGARPTRLVNLATGAERIAPARGSRDLVLGWYSGKRRAGRTHL